MKSNLHADYNECRKGIEMMLNDNEVEICWRERETEAVGRRKERFNLF
jgi:hypothetical protein